MKTAALLAGIALTLNAAMALLNLFMNLSRSGMHMMPTYLGGQLTYFLAQAALIAFFFTFFANTRE